MLFYAYISAWLHTGMGAFIFPLVNRKNEDGYDFCKGEIGCLSVGFRRQSVCRP